MKDIKTFLTESKGGNVLRVTDTHTKKSIEIPCNVANGSGLEEALNKFVRSKKVRSQIIDDLELYFGSAKLEYIVDGKVIADGKFEYDTFSGRGNITTKRCRERAA